MRPLKHDIWDRDFPAPPALVTITKDGQRRRRRADGEERNRDNLDRETGQPIYPMREVTPPASDVPGERSAPTQLLPTLPPPFARQQFTEAMITTRTPEAHAAVVERFRQFGSGMWAPPTERGIIVFPGFDGGAEWGGAAFDPDSALLYVNANEMAWRVKLAERKMPDGGPVSGKTLYLRYCAACHRADLTGTPPEFPSLAGIGTRRNIEEIATKVREGGGRMPPFAEMHSAVRRAIVEYIASGTSVMVRADTGLNRTGTATTTSSGTSPPVIGAHKWGTLTAIDMNKASIAWQVPLGEMPGSGVANSGSENYGGPVVTAGGVVFIGATVYDRKFRAFDAKTGKVWWETTLPAAGNATPAVYDVNGREFVVIGAGGGKRGGGLPLHVRGFRFSAT